MFFIVGEKKLNVQDRGFNKIRVGNLCLRGWSHKLVQSHTGDMAKDKGITSGKVWLQVQT